MFDMLSAFQDKLLEEMWKQQDSLEGPMSATPTAEMSTSPEAGGGDGASEDNSKDSNPLLERLRALEVIKWIARSSS